MGTHTSEAGNDLSLDRIQPYRRWKPTAWMLCLLKRRSAPRSCQWASGHELSSEASTDRTDQNPIRGRPQDQCLQEAGRTLIPYLAGTAKTGQGAPRTTRSVTLPRNASTNPCLPSVAMTIRSTSACAARRIAAATSPSLRVSFQVQAWVGGRFSSGKSPLFT